MSDKQPVAGSFRDPDGFLFQQDGVLYRQVNPGYRDNYQALMQSGLYRQLTGKGWLIAHKEVAAPADSNACIILQPDRVGSLSYPYEWSFSQLKDAALLTLDIQRLALASNLSLKDASAFNIQFHQGRPVFIDTLSFERYQEGQPWVAYRQFCQHFLAPLAVMAKTDIRLAQLLRSNIDGIPLPLASRLLPFSSRLNLGLGLHIHLHARSQLKNAATAVQQQTTGKRFSRQAFLALLDHLRSTVSKLQWQAVNTEWFDYYQNNNNYLDEAMTHKETLVDDFIRDTSYTRCWDLGANTGRFSRIAARYCDEVCAWDIDPACVDLHYRHCREQNSKNILPLLLDLTNPSPAIGWNHDERLSLKQRSPVDLVLALGLVHHLAISNNLPLEKIAAFLADIAHSIVIEFVPKSDSQVKKLLQNRQDIFPDYHTAHFEQVFSRHFQLVKKSGIHNSERTLYLYRKK